MDSYFELACDKEYAIELEHNNKFYYVKGILLNYCGGNIIVSETKSGGIWHIGYKDIKFMMPI